MTAQQDLLDPPAAETPASTPAATVSQALAQYDATMRARAAEAGVPTNRTACVGMRITGPLARVVFSDANGAIQVIDMRDASAARPLTLDLLREILTDAYDLNDTARAAEAKGVQMDAFHKPFVIADTATLHRVARAADKWARKHQDLPSRTLSRLMSFRCSLPFSVFTPVLTESLTSRYWLPAGAQTDDLTAWNLAFGNAKPPTSRKAFDYLIRRASDGAVDNTTMRAIVSGERYGARAGQYASDHSAASAFTKAGALHDAHAAMLAIDPTLRERNLIGGETSRVRIHQVKDDRVEAYLDEPGKIREGEKVLLFDGLDYDSKVEVTLREIEFHGDELMAVFVPPSEKQKRA